MRLADAQWLYGLLVLMAVLPGVALADPAVVYDNSTHPVAGNWIPQGLPLGFWPFSFYSSNEPMGEAVTLAGTYRNVTQFDLILKSSQPTTLPDLTLRLYLNDGLDINLAEGAPGTLLWTGTLSNLPVDGATTASFHLPGVVVPDTFIWIASADSMNAGLATFDPPTVGSCDPNYWDYDLYDGGIWVLSDFAGDPVASFGARVTAVPEPSSLAILAVGAWLTLRRRRKAPAEDAATQ